MKLVQWFRKKDQEGKIKKCSHEWEIEERVFSADIVSKCKKCGMESSIEKYQSICQHEFSCELDIYHFVKCRERRYIYTCKTCEYSFVMNYADLLLSECPHDWHILEQDDRLHTSNRRDDETKEWHHTESLFDLLNKSDMCRAFAQKKVCLICGKCVDEIKEAFDQIQDRYDEENTREDLALKLWQDCKK